MDTSTSHPARVLLQQMAAYNMWATQRLHSQVDALPEADYRRDAGLFFKTAHGTQQALAQRQAIRFNLRVHGTHHRAQITAALTAMGHACPELDWSSCCSNRIERTGCRLRQIAGSHTHHAHQQHRYQ